MDNLLKEIKPTFSGHETFPCRNFWLKKGFDYVSSEKSFSDEDAVVVLGIGKNMVSSVRYWMRSFGLLEQDKLTPLAYKIFSDSNGFDPFLEDDATLWILHYHLVKSNQASIYSIIFNQLRKEKLEFTKDNFIQFVNREYGSQNENTLNTDFSVFSRMYVRNTTRSKDREDNLSELLSELSLVDSYRSGNLEYFIVENQDRAEIPEEVILYAILETGGFDSSVNLRTLETELNSVGNIFAINKHGLYFKIQSLVEKFDFLVFNDQAGVKELQFKEKPENPFDVLKSYYGR
jgi:hypothetical protein